MKYQLASHLQYFSLVDRRAAEKARRARCHGSAGQWIAPKENAEDATRRGACCWLCTVPGQQKAPVGACATVRGELGGVWQCFVGIPHLPWVLSAGTGCVGLTRAGGELQTQGWSLQREGKILKIWALLSSLEMSC